MANVYVIEDNFVHRDFLVSEIRAFAALYGVHFLATAVNDIPAFYNQLDENKILDNDIFFLDIDLNTFINGIDIAQKIREQNKRSLLIFITADASKAIEAINYHVKPFAYMLKENNHLEKVSAELENTLKRLSSRLSERELEHDHVSFSSGSAITTSMAAEINYIQAMTGHRNHVIVKTINAEHIISMNLTQVKKAVPSKCFFTGLKSYVINLQNISGLFPQRKAILFKNQDTLSADPRTIKKIQVYQSEMGMIQ